jgi:hypothetical protein
MGPQERSLSMYKIIMLVPPLREADGTMHAPSCHGRVLAADATRATQIGTGGELLVGTYCDACFLLSDR